MTRTPHRQDDEGNAVQPVAPLDLQLLTPDELCALLKVRKSWVYDQVQAGSLPHVRLGNQLRFSRLEIAAYLGVLGS